MPSHPFRCSGWRADAGNALLSFIAVAPLVALLLIVVLEMSAVVWTREVAAEQLRIAVADAARTGGSITQVQAAVVEKFAQNGITLVDQKWAQETLGSGEYLISAAIELRPAGIALLPEMTVTVSAQAIKE